MEGRKKNVGSQGEMLREKEREGERDGVNNKWGSGGMQWIFFSRQNQFQVEHQQQFSDMKAGGVNDTTR